MYIEGPHGDKRFRRRIAFWLVVILSHHIQLIMQLIDLYIGPHGDERKMRTFESAIVKYRLQYQLTIDCSLEDREQLTTDNKSSIVYKMGKNGTLLTPKLTRLIVSIATTILALPVTH